MKALPQFAKGQDVTLIFPDRTTNTARIVWIRDGEAGLESAEAAQASKAA
ncbi:hypothetical protein [Roseibium sediminicola]|uniref:Uncharacterized protein n=1 Tax=Roseibium sediminicola TaxID=2933272 RepID=A0ABT0GW31_9HYPH|nr:hypothetical protein [Roseibium sp. CAU 1639]MCK7613659.1 hypothetical protein [Roseibium sp. CAU 1639]